MHLDKTKLWFYVRETALHRRSRRYSGWSKGTAIDTPEATKRFAMKNKPETMVSNQSRQDFSL